jgi:hypothetical protein
MEQVYIQRKRGDKCRVFFSGVTIEDDSGMLTE